VNPISVFACEAQPIVIEGLQTVLSKCEDVTFAGSVRSIGDAFDAVNRIKPDVVLIDLSSGLTSSLRLVSSLKATSQSSHGVLWVVDLPEMETFRALQMGVRGIVRKSLPIPNLLDCLRMVGNGKVWMDDSEEVSAFFQKKEASRLTPREKQVVALICRGMKNKQIAENLHITPGTVKVHLMHIFEKTGLKDRLALAVHGRELVGIEQFRDNAIA
jgi:two-component system, NarL family, nitrate/nitrite response regulator NarL